MSVSSIWLSRFLDLANLVSSWSKDPSSKVGAVIFKENRIISLGFNGFPKNVRDDDTLNNREIKYKKVIHAEENAILFAKQDLSDCSIITTHHPCSNCSAKIIQSSISNIYCPIPDPEFLERWSESIDVSQDMFKQAKVNFSYLTKSGKEISIN